MSRLVWNPEPALARLADKVGSGVETTANDIRDMAKKLAPVRKAYPGRSSRGVDIADFNTGVVRGGGRTTGRDIRRAAKAVGFDIPVGRGKPGRRIIGIGSRNQGRNAWSQRQLRNVGVRTLTSGKRQFVPQPGMRGQAARDIRSARNVTAAERYTYKGRNIGRGVVKVGQGYQYGGFLRRNIVAEDVEFSDTEIRYRVISRAPYSRYVEFPTSRTAAQPFLLPAFKAYRNALAKNIRKSGRSR